MQFGGAMFFTDYSMSAMELARALEERGFESVWAPEHSHIPLSRTQFPGGPVRGAGRGPASLPEP
jgi:alkanesulfonate monooxygenase SsuD/methylene tetrahydromethanopterin reductase-like flavin-dependent oxidoreductase (luciferase family)